MMIPHLRAAALLAALAAGALAVAGCGSSDTSAGSSTAAHSATSGHSMSSMTTTSTAHSGHNASQMQGMTALQAGADGTSASAGGLTFKAMRRTLPTGRTTAVQLHVVDSKGMPVTSFDRDQTKLMHLIVVRKDLSSYQHVHPVLGADGIFTIALELPSSGSYRAIADFTTAGKRYALGTTLTAPGSSTAAALPAASRTSRTDGYEVMLDDTNVMAGKEASLKFHVSRGGAPLTALQSYLGASGHLVALHRPDLAYSHIHPVRSDAASGTISFAADFAAAGTYRMFLQFRAGGVVHTAPFTITVGA